MASRIFKRVGQALVGGVALCATIAAAHAETVLRFATTLPPQVRLVPDVFDIWAERVTADSNGELRIEVINGPTIANARNVYERVTTGVVDIGWATIGALPKPFPATSVATLPFVVGEQQTVAGSRAMWSIYEGGLLDDEFADIRPIGFVTPGIALHTASPVSSLKELAALKIGVNGKAQADPIAALGGSPVSLVAPEFYQSIGTGVVDGNVMPYSGLLAFKLQEVTSHHLDASIAGGVGMVFMNVDAYNALPDDAKAALDKHSGLVASERLGTWFQGFDNDTREMLRGMEGHTVASLSKEEAARWRDATQPVVDQWIADVPNGRAILDAYMAAIGEASE